MSNGVNVLKDRRFLQKLWELVAEEMKEAEVMPLPPKVGRAQLLIHS